MKILEYLLSEFKQHHFYIAYAYSLAVYDFVSIKNILLDVYAKLNVI